MACNEQRSQVSTADPAAVRQSRDQRDSKDEKTMRERALDKTIADSFPTSDPPSSIPDPAAGEDALSPDEAA